MQTRIRNSLAGICLLAAASGVQAAPETLDLMVLYTEDALQHPNGADMEARIAASVEWTNQAFRSSNIDARLRLVHTGQVGAPFNGNLSNADLATLRDDPAVNRLRQAHGADFVTLIGPSSDWCGVGYVTQGHSDTGQLNPGSGNWAFNLVSIGCGHTTFAHELGHNMALGHSAAQNSRGGVWPWGRGHGEQGNFATIMAYPHSYGTRTRVQYFSNPGLYDCQGSACGVDHQQAQGADAARNINLLATQLANFMPNRHPLTEGEAGTGDGPGSLCEKPHLEGNLITEGDFNELSAWSSFMNVGDLVQITDNRDCGRDNRLLVQNRTESYAGPMQDLSNVLRAGESYDLSLLAQLADGDSSREPLGVALRIRDDNGARWDYLINASVTAGEYTSLETRFTPDIQGELQGADLLIYGPGAHTSVLLDEVLLTSAQSENSSFLIHSNYEYDLDGWQDTFGTSLVRTEDTAAEGRYSLKVTDRSHWYSGTSRDVKGLIEAGDYYQLSLQALVTDSSRDSQPVDVRLFVRDNNGPRWESIGFTRISSGQWHELDYDLNLDIQGPLEQAELHIFGPGSGVDLYLDQLILQQVP